MKIRFKKKSSSGHNRKLIQRNILSNEKSFSESVNFILLAQLWKSQPPRFRSKRFPP